MKKISAQINAGERKIILLLCLLAAAHVLIFSAVFPFFGVVDEQSHFDLVVHYSQAQPPRTLAHTDKDALPYIVYFSTWEYLFDPAGQPGGGYSAPPWKLPPAVAQQRLAPREQFWRETVVNHEAAQPPLYYVVAGGWWRVGQLLGLTDGSLLFWLRALNALFLVALVWLAGAIAQQIFPENRFMQVAVPALTAFFPQSIFYAINNDILSPLVFGAAFMLLLKFWEADIPGRRLATATGLALAATFLTKMSNLPLLAVAAIFLVIKMWRLSKNGSLRASAVSLVSLALCSVLPMLAWMTWCRVNFGDLMGSAQKIKFLNWTDKPFADWFHHPLFTAQGFWFFLKTNLATLWQGEQLWHRQPMTHPNVDLAYVVLTLGTLMFTLVTLLRPRAGFTTPQRTAMAFGFSCLLAVLAFFALLSVKYDFQDCFYPSREHPYFVSGRLMLGMLIPFLILIAAGLDRLMKHFQATTKYLVLLALLAFMLASEIATDWPVFGSDYNWLHM